ncbi:MAG: hypothetical protein IMF11_19300 [Proteobacteria bacterium]|nr:hypothetical protein [Pseudomonadota bacterium]
MKLPKRLAWLLIALLLVCVAYEMWPERPTATILRGYDGLQGNVHITPRLSVQFWHKGELFATNDRFVFRSQDKGISWEKVAKLAPGKNGPVGLLRDWVGRLKLVRRLRGSCGPNLRLLRDSTILVACGGIFRGGLAEEEIVRLDKAHTGPTMLSQGWAEDRKGVVFFGEYQCGNHAVTNLYWSRNQAEPGTYAMNFQGHRSGIFTVLPMILTVTCYG